MKNIHERLFISFCFETRWIDGIDDSQETDVHYRYVTTEPLWYLWIKIAPSRVSRHFQKIRGSWILRSWLNSYVGKNWAKSKGVFRLLWCCYGNLYSCKKTKNCKMLRNHWKHFSNEHAKKQSIDLSNLCCSKAPKLYWNSSRGYDRW